MLKRKVVSLVGMFLIHTLKDWNIVAWGMGSTGTNCKVGLPTSWPLFVRL